MLVNDNHGLNGLAFIHIFISLINLVQAIAMGEDATWIDIAIKDGLEQELLVIGGDRGCSSCNRNVLGKGRTKGTVIVVRDTDEA